MSNKYMWRKRSTSAKYVDSMTGDDLRGDGTMQNPYRTLGKAWRGSSTSRPSSIICRGRFCEDMADGNHSCSISGDYMGAAYFDGEDSYLIYGFGHSDLIIGNCPAATFDLVVHTGSWSLAGVGRAADAYYVGVASLVYGVVGSSAFVGKSPLYMGCIGGNSAVKYLTVWKPRINESTKLWFGGNDGPIQHITVYDVPMSMRRKDPGSQRPVFGAGLFAKCDFYLDDRVNFNECMFAADCGWYYNGAQIDTEGKTGEDLQAFLLAKMDALGVATNSRPVFTNCVFSTETSDEIFNNAGAGDLTLRPESTAVRNERRYFGALAPAINVPIMDSSAGKKETWDEQSAAGLIKVSGNAICVDENSSETTGNIVSKVLKIDTTKMSLTAILTKFGAKWSTHGIHLSSQTSLGSNYAPGDTLPVGRYMAVGDVVYKNANYPSGYVVAVTEENTTFASDATATPSTLRAINDPNIANVCYVRSTPAIYAMVTASDALQRGGIYYNFGAKSITYRGRTIAPGESFVAANATDKFTAPAGDSSYKVGVMFDDTRVPSQEWIPAQLFGEYFVYKVNGVVQLDTDGVPISSGNPLSYQPNSEGGYATSIVKSVLKERYCQFKIVASKL